MREIIDRPSPNFDERKLPVSMIVVHYTETKTCEQALRILCDPNAAKRVSSHWVIDRDGTVYRLVDESKRAWHAGKRKSAKKEPSPDDVLSGTDI